ncbi:MAG: ribosomal-processing cysteine protease Prp [Ruminiclostridium sp.]|nr:ribosomal-processing cysteine protease Prp [Ruminiclostridium sp.]
MINVSIERDGSGFIRQFTVEGHAEYADPGRDIICAAASVTAYTAVGALEELAGIKDCYSEKDGYFSCKIPNDIANRQQETARTILETMVIGFKQIELAHKEFLTVFEQRQQSPTS